MSDENKQEGLAKANEYANRIEIVPTQGARLYDVADASIDFAEQARKPVDLKIEKIPADISKPATETGAVRVYPEDFTSQLVARALDVRHENTAQAFNLHASPAKIVQAADDAMMGAIIVYPKTTADVKEAAAHAILIALENKDKLTVMAAGAPGQDNATGFATKNLMPIFTDDTVPEIVARRAAFRGEEETQAPAQAAKQAAPAVTR